MLRLLQASLLAAALAAAPAAADPDIAVRYEDELLRVTLDGSYGGLYYQVWRSGEYAGEYAPFSFQPTLCTGDCYLIDLEAVPGQTYYYRFDLFPPSGEVVSYGPYPVTVPDTPIGARLWPNPSNAAVRVELSVPGSTRRDAAVRAEAKVLDLQGRTVRTLHSGTLARGVTSIAWDGRADSGQPLGSGIYFLRLTTPLGSSTTRVVRFR